MQNIKMELHGSSKVKFTVQSGDLSNLKKEDIYARFKGFGKIKYVRFQTSSTNSGTVIFHKAYDAKKTLNKVVEVKGCLLHISSLLSDLSPFPSGHQILIQSSNLPKCWEKNIIVKGFFKKFGEVNGINFTDRGLVVSFQEDIASKMTGTLLQVKVEKYNYLQPSVSGALGSGASLRQGSLLLHSLLEAGTQTLHIMGFICIHCVVSHDFA